ncbi:hypothetical protein E4U32_007684 [Claviceps aff. humidiphila group G2b]|nr:hypothetical protein E4U32_007684 [Claviceps aff. humidiphila group G2b]
MVESLGSDYQPSSQGSHPEPSFPQGSDSSTLPPVSTPDADVPYIEGTTTLDDLAITDTDMERKLYDTLLLLPSELDTIVVRPRNTTSEPGMIRQFRSAFRVRREAIAQLFNWLARNSPLYRGVVIGHDRLQQLPVDGDVSNQLPTIEANAVQAEQEMRDAAATDNDITDGDEFCISWHTRRVWTRSRNRFSNNPTRPQLSRSRFDQRHQTYHCVECAAKSPRRPHKTRWGMHSIHNPLHRLKAPKPRVLRAFSLWSHRPRKWVPPIGHQLHLLQGNLPCVSRASDIRRLMRSDRRNPCWRWHFPPLYPHGTGDYFEARLRTVTFKEYILRALELLDGRLVQHPRFRYVVYNMWIRTFYLKKDQREDITIEKLREMFNQDSEHSASNTVPLEVLFSAVLVEHLPQLLNCDVLVGGTVFGVLVEHLPQLLNCDVLTLILFEVECTPLVCLRANPHVVHNVAELGALGKPPIRKLESTQYVFFESYRA